MSPTSASQAGASRTVVDEQVHRRVVHAMGMPISLALRGPGSTGPAADEAWSAVVAELREVDRVFSTYRADSVINRLDRGELDLAGCPAEVVEVLTLGRQAEERSGGAFSINLPDPEGRTRLDPSGVVKGWAVERAARFFEDLPATDYCLSAGGDLVGRVVSRERAPWRIGIEHPHHPRRLVATVPVRSGAVATSGTTHRGQHLRDARTGRAPAGVASVTVIGPSLGTADIDATAAYAHGPRAADWLRSQPGRTGLVVWPDGTTTSVDGRRTAPRP